MLGATEADARSPGAGFCGPATLKRRLRQRMCRKTHAALDHAGPGPVVHLVGLLGNGDVHGFGYTLETITPPKTHHPQKA